MNKVHLRSYFTGTDVLNYMEIHVGNNKDGRTNNLCDRFYQRRDYREALVECFQPVSGKYVTIRTPFSDPIKLCEVQVLGKPLSVLVLHMIN